VADAGLVRLETGEQRRARWTAARRVVELREAHTVAGKAVNIGRPNLTAVTTDIGEAHGARENDDDIGPSNNGRDWSCGGQNGWAKEKNRASER